MRHIILLMMITVLSIIPTAAQDNLCSRTQPCFGTSLSPLSYESDDFVQFLSEAPEMGMILNWAGSIAEIENPEAAPTIIPQVARNFNFVPMVQFQIFDLETGARIPIAFEPEIITILQEYVTTIEPEFLTFGMEVNLLFDRNPEAYADYVAIYDDVVAAIREASPHTQVIALFQYEQLLGYRGGLYGGENDPTDVNLALLDDFADADILAFTTYPGIIFPNPADIPDDFYTPLETLEQPIAFTEIGWHSNDNIGAGWDSSEAEQAAFIERFANLTSEYCPVMLIWSFVYDPDIFAPFDSMGLRAADGTTRLGWDTWQELQDNPNDCE